MSDHRVEIYIDNGGTVDWTITCSATEGAECRMWCGNGCETHDAIPDCRLTDQGHCVQTSGWFDDSPLIPELYNGPVVPLRPGPVEVEWDGEQYLWHYTPKVSE